MVLADVDRIVALIVFVLDVKVVGAASGFRRQRLIKETAAGVAGVAVLSSAIPTAVVGLVVVVLVGLLLLVRADVVFGGTAPMVVPIVRVALLLVAVTGPPALITRGVISLLVAIVFAFAPLAVVVSSAVALPLRPAIPAALRIALFGLLLPSGGKTPRGARGQERGGRNPHGKGRDAAGDSLGVPEHC